MRKFLAVCLILSLSISFLVLPASAAERYELYEVPRDIMFLDESFDFDFSEGAAFYTENTLQSGTYDLYFYFYDGFGDGLHCLSLRNIVISFNGDIFNFENIVGSFAHNSGETFDTSLSGSIVLYDGYSVLTVYSDVFDYEVYENTFVSGFMTLIESKSIVDSVSGLDFSCVMDGVVALIPPVLGVLVCYIGIRKGLAYLQSLLHNA